MYTTKTSDVTQQFLAVAEEHAPVAAALFNRVGEPMMSVEAKWDDGYNYCQIFRQPFSQTSTLAASESGDDETLSRLMKSVIVEFAISIEWQILHGVREIDTTGTNPRFVMGGLGDAAVWDGEKVTAGFVAVRLLRAPTLLTILGPVDADATRMEYLAEFTLAKRA
jgi:hypothetical protein